MSQRRMFLRPAVLVIEAIGKKLAQRKLHFGHGFADPGQTSGGGMAAPYDGLFERWGPLRTHLLASSLSALNGCRSKTQKHIRSFQLHYFKARGRLFPIDEAEFLALTEAGPDEMIESLVAHLVRANLAEETDPLRRTFELYVFPSKAKDGRDGRLMELIEILSAAGDDSHAEASPTDMDYDAIVSDADLSARYDALRQQAA